MKRINIIFIFNEYVKMSVQHFTLESVDEKHYNRISVTIPSMCFISKVVVNVSQLLTNCNIRVLKDSDYLRMKIGGVIKDFQFEDRTDMNTSTVYTMLYEKLIDDGVTVILDGSNRIGFESENEFSILDWTYNVGLLTGLYGIKNKDSLSEGLKAIKDGDKYKLTIESVGMCLSTPILYLVSNVGSLAFRNTENNNLQSCVIVMRIVNSFVNGMPIIASNCEFSQTITSTDITGSSFVLVDSNMHEIDLLNPMYITIQVSEAQS